ncbi:hypothetical protein BX616_003308 [Lobosporangium transversale]|uniref:Uncharacterized protein n=1 Tax=Lobosporangium transversale TaxID=64571 RepID=A0A1Y2GYQ3_9FUNG|nr:hypothetical protein BCR41DRAFT_367755 [Lobosporangium transversale]KAF9899070.1 hypothetical protein BX616_003308 [Lobosporangium transversale]ORZ27407.1 hypothetical protein BCR41DRAFT_367755 [Lobosporangium transversale]|eukprot:XP_021885134.1 hypothetical protein BCR41DRAFT_367755 [Lobosporangium transversale]
MALCLPSIPLPLLHEMKGKDLSTTLIPDIKEDLMKIKVSLDEFRSWVDGYLSKLEISLCGTPIGEAKTLTIEFLVCLVRYCTGTLPDLYMVVDRIRTLMTRYDHVFRVFASEAKDTILFLEDLIESVPNFRQEHIETAKMFFSISLRAQKLIGEYNEASSSHNKSAKKYTAAEGTALRVASAGLGVLALVAIPCPPLAIITRVGHAAALTTVVAGAGVACCYTAATHNSGKARVYSLGATNMGELDRCSNVMKESAFNIGDKLYDCKNLLKGVKDHSKPTTAGMYTADIQEEEYRLAKGKAEEMKKLCDIIMYSANQITQLGMTAEFKMSLLK